MAKTKGRSGMNGRDAGGYVYVLTNPAMPGLVKIGRTRRDPVTRLAEINSATGVPVPFELVGAVKSKDAVALEREIHSRLAPSRVNRKREFFRCSPRKATSEAKTAAKRHGSRYVRGRRLSASVPRPRVASGSAAFLAGLTWLSTYEVVLATVWTIFCIWCFVTGRPRNLAEALGLPDAFGWPGIITALTLALIPVFCLDGPISINRLAALQHFAGAG